MINIWNHIIVLGFAIAALVGCVMAIRISVVPMLAFFTGDLPGKPEVTQGNSKTATIKVYAHDTDTDS